MAKLSEIYSEDFRNLSPSRLELSPCHNIFLGPNGSGKTSLLELVHLLGTGKSFRTKVLDYLISFSQTGFLVRSHNLITNSQIGLEKKRGKRLKAKLAGDVCLSASDLVDQLPLVLINSDTFQLLEGGPSHRRALLDWILFHVKQSSRLSLSKFKKALAQRNEALKRARYEQMTVKAWDELLTELVQAVDQLRQEILQGFIPIVQHHLTKILPGIEIDFEYLPGWPADMSYMQALEQNFQTDMRLGYTELGPHRADLLIMINGVPASQVLSRGQSKLLVIALKLAQASFLWEEKQAECVYLLDDLQSELDLDAQIRVLSTLKAWGVQSFVTGTSLQSRVLESLTDEDKLFHVEQGQVIKLPSKAVAESVEY